MMGIGMSRKVCYSGCQSVRVGCRAGCQEAQGRVLMAGVGVF